MSINRNYYTVVITDNANPSFTHGQFHVACSRVSSEKMYIFIIHASNKKTNNIVHQEVL